jgi:predicted transcriptional regulator
MELFNHLKKHYGLRNDTDIAEFLGVSQGVICQLRSGKQKPTANTILKVYDKTALSITLIRKMMGVKNG